MNYFSEYWPDIAALVGATTIMCSSFKFLKQANHLYDLGDKVWDKNLKHQELCKELKESLDIQLKHCSESQADQEGAQQILTKSLEMAKDLIGKQVESHQLLSDTLEMARETLGDITGQMDESRKLKEDFEAIVEKYKPFLKALEDLERKNKVGRPKKKSGGDDVVVS